MEKSKIIRGVSLLDRLETEVRKNVHDLSMKKTLSSRQYTISFPCSCGTEIDRVTVSTGATFSILSGFVSLGSPIWRNVCWKRNVIQKRIYLWKGIHTLWRWTKLIIRKRSRNWSSLRWNVLRNKEYEFRKIKHFWFLFGPLKTPPQNFANISIIPFTRWSYLKVL